jgi:hypothetical protein
MAPQYSVARNNSPLWLQSLCELELMPPWPSVLTTCPGLHPSLCSSQPSLSCIPQTQLACPHGKICELAVPSTWKYPHNLLPATFKSLFKCQLSGRPELNITTLLQHSIPLLCFYFYPLSPSSIVSIFYLCSLCSASLHEEREFCLFVCGSVPLCSDTAKYIRGFTRQLFCHCNKVSEVINL